MSMDRDRAPVYLPSALYGAVPRALTRRRKWYDNISRGGKMLFLLCLLMAASPYKELRFPLGGLYVHPYIILLIPLFYVGAIPRVSRIPKTMLYSLFLFAFLYCTSVALGEEQDIGSMVKIVTSAVTILTVALLVRRTEDYQIAVVALGCAAAVLSAQNLVGEGIFREVMEKWEAIGNRNAFSLYVLPPLLLVCNMALDASVKKWLRLLLAFFALIMIVAIFATGNRSGWLGVLFIVVSLIGGGRRLRSIVLFALLGVGAYYILAEVVRPVVFQQRVEQTVKGNLSDETRFDLVFASLQIGYENPFFGASPQGLSVELAKEFPDRSVWAGEELLIDPHNVIAHLLGGTGILTTIALLVFGSTLWGRPKNLFSLRTTVKWKENPHTMLRVLLMLWVFRGMFTGEVLYSPAFCMAFGLLIGMCILEGVWERRPPPRLQRVRLPGSERSEKGHLNTTAIPGLPRSL